MQAVPASYLLPGWLTRTRLPVAAGLRSHCFPDLVLLWFCKPSPRPWGLWPQLLSEPSVMSPSCFLGFSYLFFCATYKGPIWLDQAHWIFFCQNNTSRGVTRGGRRDGSQDATCHISIACVLWVGLCVCVCLCAPRLQEDHLAKGVLNFKPWIISPNFPPYT